MAGTAHPCSVLCADPAHRSDELYRIGGLADDIEAQQVIAEYLADTGTLDPKAAPGHARAIGARLVSKGLFVCRLYQEEP